MTDYKLRIIPLYTGCNTVDDILKNKKGLDLLWLEILVNDGIPWEDYLHIPEINTAYQKAYIWYTNFKTMLNTVVNRKPLLNLNIKGTVDEREYRKFLEVLNFVKS